MLDPFHKHSCIQKPNCWNQPVTLDQVEKSTVWKVQEEAEWNEWQEVKNELCVDVSHTDLCDIFDLLVGDFICVLNEELKNAIE